MTQRPLLTSVIVWLGVSLAMAHIVIAIAGEPSGGRGGLLLVCLADTIALLPPRFDPAIQIKEHQMREKERK